MDGSLKIAPLAALPVEKMRNPFGAFRHVRGARPAGEIARNERATVEHLKPLTRTAFAMMAASGAISRAGQ